MIQQCVCTYSVFYNIPLACLLWNEMHQQIHIRYSIFSKCLWSVLCKFVQRSNIFNMLSIKCPSKSFSDKIYFTHASVKFSIKCPDKSLSDITSLAHASVTFSIKCSSKSFSGISSLTHASVKISIKCPSMDFSYITSFTHASPKFSIKCSSKSFSDI